MEMPEESGVESDRTVVYRPTVGKCKDGHVLIFCTRTVLTFLSRVVPHRTMKYLVLNLRYIDFALHPLPSNPRVTVVFD